MTNEEKQLLLKDLCARLPYGVKVKVTLPWANDVEFASDIKIRTLNASLLDVVLDNDNPGVKPYLRPMSSMTKEEREELIREFGVDIRDEDNGRHTEEYWYVMVYHKFKEESWFIPFEAIDFLNAHHFDYRGLIEKGLALEAPEGMYKKMEE